MPALTIEQLDFLNGLDVPADRVFDATGLAPAEYKSVMSIQQQWVAYGVTPCRKARHSLRTRSGHCVQCKPSQLSYLRRHDEAADVYVAESKLLGLVKIGIAQSAADRVKLLNKEFHALTFDWTLKFSQRIDRAGKIEARLHTLLAEQRADARYVKAGKLVRSREVFRCSPTTAIKHVKSVLTARAVDD